MPPLARAALPILVVALGACRKNVPSSKITGSFVRQDALIPGMVTRLNVTPTGVAVTSPSLGTSGSLEIGGEPLLKGSTRVDLGFVAQGAALFSNLACNDDACTFATKNGCEGTLTADAKGDVVLVATGECGPWSGKWLREGDAPPPPGASGGAACPACPACPPCAPPPPPPPSPPESGRCMMDCNHAQMSCVQQCRIGDTSCMQTCSATTTTCVQRCR
jgi:hypothetical protein